MGTSVLGLWALSGGGAHISIGLIGAGGIVGALGAIMPDIDHPDSKASRGVPFAILAELATAVVGLIALAFWERTPMGASAAVVLGDLPAHAWRWVGILVGLSVAMLAASAGVRSFTRHRGITHSLGFGGIATVVAAIGLLIAGLPVWFALVFAWGWVTHLVTDAMTPDGLPDLLWPFDRLRVQARVSTSAGPPLPVRGEHRPPAPAPAPAPNRPVPIPEVPTPQSPPTCPSCGVPMILRTARKGAHAGSQFYGCPNYPKCRRVVAR